MKEPLESVTEAGHRLGEYIRDQRRGSQISLRQLATLAGVSNPYLSQIERGLRHPSAEILQQIAKGLRISAEALYLQAGILEPREGGRAVVDAVLADEGLTERQKQVLLEIYDSFRKEDAAAGPAAGAGETGARETGAVAPTASTSGAAAAAPAAGGPARTRTSRTRPKKSTTTPVGGSAASATPTTPQEASA